LLLADSSAVPVLPATVTPGICAAVPVPRWTTCTIMSRIAAAVAGFVACLQVRGCSFEITPPPGARTSFTSLGTGTFPLFAIAAATSAICSGVTSIRSWPNASRPGSTWLFAFFGSKRFDPL
jgi:hypothetical protein